MHNARAKGPCVGWESRGTLRKSWDLKGKEWENGQGNLFTQGGIKDAHSMLLEKKSIFFISKTPWKRSFKK